MANDVAAASGPLTAMLRGLNDNDARRDGMQAVTDPEKPLDDLNDDAADVEDCADESAADESAADERGSSSKQRMSAPWRATLFGLAVVVALSVLVGWLGFRVYQSHQAQAQRNQFLQVARQGALNLTTIDWQHADADTHRILDGATGELYDDFAKRSQPFIDVVKQVKMTTVGTVTEAGLESQTPDSAQALVAVTVQMSKAGEPDQAPREWRLRITVQKVDDQVKVSDAGFVP